MKHGRQLVGPPVCDQSGAGFRFVAHANAIPEDALGRPGWRVKGRSKARGGTRGGAVPPGLAAGGGYRGDGRMNNQERSPDYGLSDKVGHRVGYFAESILHDTRVPQQSTPNADGGDIGFR